MTTTAPPPPPRHPVRRQRCSPSLRRTPSSPESPSQDGRKLLDVVSQVRILLPVPVDSVLGSRIRELSCWLCVRSGASSKQLLEPDDVDKVQQADHDRGITKEEFRLVKIHMSSRELLLAHHPPSPACLLL
ncbi:hypothetical protein ABZP36_033721 [Zizania latifolia]